MNINLERMFEEYSSKNIAMVLIEDMNKNDEKIYFKVRISGKNIIKKIVLKRENQSEKIFYERSRHKIHAIPHHFPVRVLFVRYTKLYET